MNRYSFVFYKDWKEAIATLPDEIRLEIYESIIEYATTGNVQGLRPLAGVAFNFIKTTIDRDIERYMSIVERNRENGSKGGRKKETQMNPKNPVGFLETQMNPKNLDNDNDSDKNNLSITPNGDNAMSNNPSDSSTMQDGIDYKKLVEYFNQETKGVFGVIRYPISDKRRGAIRARIREHGKKAFMEMVNKACESNFLKGENKNGFKATFDWLVKPTNFPKVLEDNYRNDRYGNNKTIGGSSGINEGFMRNVAEGIARGVSEE